MMRVTIATWLLLIGFTLPVAFATEAAGEPDCSKTERRDGKDQDGNTVNCLWTVCEELECSASGDKISDCKKKTSYKDPRDCRDPEPSD